MNRMYTIEVDKYSPTALTYCLKKLESVIPDYEYDWRIIVNAGGIDYGVFLNIDTQEKQIEICNQPSVNGVDFLEDVIEMFKIENDEQEQ